MLGSFQPFNSSLNNTPRKNPSTALSEIFALRTPCDDIDLRFKAVYDIFQPMENPRTLNRVETERKLSTALHLSFPKAPETEQGIIDFLNAHFEDFASRISGQHNEASLQTKTALREDLRKELASKEDVLLVKAEIIQVKTELQAEIQQVKTELQTEIQQVRTELKAEIQWVRAEIKLSNLKTNFQTALVILVILLTTPGGLHLLEKLFPWFG